jgi:GntR family transcriptional regulator
VSALVAIDHRHPIPLHAQLEQGIRGAIASGRLPVGAQLPTVRQLAVDLRVNANTVARVYVELERAGLLETRRGVGTFVAARQPAGARKGNTAELEALVRRLLDEAAARGFSPAEVSRQVERQLRKQGGESWR